MSRLAKVLFDVGLSLVGLAATLPIMLVVTFVIRLTSPGPVIYRQLRVGKGGKEFWLYKFRTMTHYPVATGSSVTVTGDPRITRVGRFLRRTKLDELPQLWNVVKGDMSLVGPRPEVPEIVRHYSADMMRILDVRPGITSVASLHLRREEDLLAAAHDPERVYVEVVVPAKVSLGMEHVLRNSFLYDYRILLLTLRVLLTGWFWPLPEHPIVDEIRRGITLFNATSQERPEESVSQTTRYCRSV